MSMPYYGSNAQQQQQQQQRGINLIGLAPVLFFLDLYRMIV